ncbi:hypothetical protein I3A86_25265, partial [Salmonella enterica]|nr:hypothetical protein [Salmonella enterica]
ILFCDYGVDPSDPTLGLVLASYDDDKVPAGEPYEGCIAVPHAGALEDLEKLGPEPEKLGDEPRSHHKSHVELDAEGINLDHPWRAIAGRPITDNRQPAVDMRPRMAPRLTLDVAQSAATWKVSRAATLAHDAGFPCDALGSTFTYGSDDEASRKLQLAAIAALSGQSKPGWTATLQCADEAGANAGRPHNASQVHR